MTNITKSTVDSDQIKSIQLKPFTGLVKVILWLVTLVFLPQTLFLFLFALLIALFQGTTISQEIMLNEIPLLLTAMLFSPLITIPLLITATDENSWRTRFDFWSIKTIDQKTLLKWLVLGVIFWGATSLSELFLDFPLEPFMLKIKTANDSVLMLILTISTICIVAPIMEEIVFRGWLFRRISQTKLGNVGALLTTSLLFTLIHNQYEQGVTFIFVFSLGIFLGLIRYKSNNISYCIILHMFFNALGMTALFFI